MKMIGFGPLTMRSIGHQFAPWLTLPMRRIIGRPLIRRAAASLKQSRDESNEIKRNPLRSSGNEEDGSVIRFIAYYTGTAAANSRMISARPSYRPNIVSAKTCALIGCALLRGSSDPRRAAHSRTPIPGGITLFVGNFVPIDN